MNKPTKTLLTFLALLSCAGCDTKEDAFTVGDRPRDEEILKVGQLQLNFKPEGETIELSITSIARWEVSMPNNDYNQFTVEPTSGKGNGTVRVKCNPNTTQSSHQVELRITPVNFESAVKTVSLVQNFAAFNIDTFPSPDPVAEEGGAERALGMTVYSSLDWQLDIVENSDGSIGDIEWLSISPGLSGEGNSDNKPIYFSFVWTPNYEQRDRIISLQLKTTSNIGVDKPKPFTLRQNAGTLPQYVSCKLESLDIVDAYVVLKYSSRSAVKDCGVRVYKVDDGKRTLWTTVKPEVADFSLSGDYRLPLKGLPEASLIRVEPFVENHVGVYVGIQDGESCEFQTGTKPENMRYPGVSILNTKEHPITALAEQTSAVISFTVDSDVEPLGTNPYESVTLSIDGYSMSRDPESKEGRTWKYSFTLDGLNPNQEYEYKIEVIGKALPQSQGIVIKNTDTFTGKFKTKGKTPDDNDNNKPIVGE